MSEKEKNTETKETTKNKKGLKIALITLLIIVVIAGASVGGYFGYKYYSENKSTGTEWGDIYFNYLNNESNNENPFSINKYKDTKVGFIDEGKENPIMFVTGNWTIASTDGSTETTKYVDLYEINEDNKVTYMGGLGSKDMKIEFLYDVPNKKYDYFFVNKNDTYSQYTSVDTYMNDLLKENELKQSIAPGKTNAEMTTEEYQKLSSQLQEYKTSNTSRAEYMIENEKSVVTQNTLSGGTISYNKQDEYIIDTGIEEKTFDYSKNMNKAELRNNVEIGVTDYKKDEEIVTDEIKEKVDNKTQETEKIKADVENAKAEIKAEEARKAAEEAARKAAEEAALGLKVGKYRLKYGTYKLDNNMGMGLVGTIVINQDGTFHIKSNFNQDSGQTENFDEDGTYTVGKEYNSFELQDAINFRTKSGRSFGFFVVQNNKMSSQWIGYNYAGN